MGFFDKIKKAASSVVSTVKNVASNVVNTVKNVAQPVAKVVSNTYKAVDTKVGGALPGGVSKAEADRANAAKKAEAQRVADLKKQKEANDRAQEDARRAAEKKEQDAAAAKEKEKSLLGKVVDTAKSLFGGPDLSQTGTTGTPQEVANKVALLENEIAINKQLVEAGDKYEFLYSRTKQIAEAEAEILRLEAGGDLNKPTQMIYNVVPISFGPAGAAAAAGEVQTTLSGGIVAANNAKTAIQTTSWIAKLGGALKSPYAVAGALVSAIGSYPFAGFIKEEALQTLGFATKSAISNNDISGADASIKLQEQTLDPDLWDKILGKVPFANVLNELKNFYDAAKLKVNIDKRIVEDLKVQQQTGESEADKWERIYAEQDAREAQRQQDQLDFQKQLSDMKARAAAEQRKIDEKYWDKVFKDREERLKKDREAEQKYYEEYAKRAQEIRDANAPSNLNFGLL